MWLRLLLKVNIQLPGRTMSKPKAYARVLKLELHPLTRAVAAQNLLSFTGACGLRKYRRPRGQNLVNLARTITCNADGGSDSIVLCRHLQENWNFYNRCCSTFASWCWSKNSHPRKSTSLWNLLFPYNERHGTINSALEAVEKKL